MADKAEHQRLLQATLNAAAARRRVLLDGMAALSDVGTDCVNCSGVCCTFVANSMQITPREALDILAHLEAQPDWADTKAAYMEAWRSAVARHALDRPPPGDGRRDLVRRRYTCPFYGGGRLGCGLPPAVKPYGCLGFNPRRADVADGEDCQVDGPLLAAHQQELTVMAADDALASELAEAFPARFDKLPIPAALLALYDLN